jgi:hypothetical protein
MISSEKGTCREAQHPTSACEHAAQQEASDVNRISAEANDKFDQKAVTRFPLGDDTPPFLKISLPPPFFVCWMSLHKRIYRDAIPMAQTNRCCQVKC